MEERELRDLSYRVARIERMLVGAYCAVVAVVLLLGGLVPFLTEQVRDRATDADVERVWSIFSAVFMPSGADGFALEEVLLRGGFIGLALVVLLLVFGPVLAAGRGVLGRRMRRFGIVLVVLGAVGGLVPLFGTIGALAGGDRSVAGWGGVLLEAGVLLTAPLLLERAKPLVSQE